MAKVSPEDTEATALRNVITPKLHDDLDRALGTLPERRRDIFLAHFLDGVPYSDLSLQYGVTEKRIGAIVSSTRRRLQDVTSLRQYLDMIS